jgi:FHA domain
MEKTYQPPPWAAASPVPGYSIEILKEGTIIEKIKLDSKTHFILGRMGGSVDILMEHVSISRHHCCLQFRDDGILMALDLGSAQGSFLNKVKLAKDVYQRLNVGDILRFGASTRMYIVNGPAEQMPSEYDSDNMKAYREKLQQRSAKVEAEKQVIAASGVSWGFDEDAENPQSDEEVEAEELPDYIKNDENYDRKHGKKYSAGLADESSSETKIKDAAILEKIRTKERKIQNMQEEIRRIYLKEASQSDGLTEGQSAAVRRNDKRIEELKESIQDLLDQIKTKNAHREGKPSAGDEKKRLKENMADADELLDTTCQTADISTNWRLKKKLAKQGDGIRDIKSKELSNGHSGSSSLSYEDLKQQKGEQQVIVDNIQKRICELEKIVHDVSEYLAKVSASANQSGPNSSNASEEDDVEIFVLKARSQDASSSLKNLKIEETSAVRVLNSISKLLLIATPALQLKININADSRISAQDGGLSSRGMPTPESTPTHKEYTINSIEKGAKNENESKSEASTAETVSSTIVLPEENDSDGTSKKAIGECDINSNSDLNLNIEMKKKEEKKESRKRIRQEEVSQMQSLSSFMKFAEIEKKKMELEQELQKLKESNNEMNDSETDVENSKNVKTVRSKDEFSMSAPGPRNKDPSADQNNVVKKKAAASVPKGPQNSADPGPNIPFEKKKSASVSPAVVLEGGESIWIPPKNQTGDGRTALNARLGY